MSETEHFYCDDCEAVDCECGGGFYAETNPSIEIDCPCCGSTEVQP